MADTSNLSNYLKDVADAIREKKGTEEQILAANFDTEIRSIETGIDTSSDNPITANDVVEGKEGFANGNKIIGNVKPIIANEIMQDLSANIDNVLGSTDITAINLSNGITIPLNMIPEDIQNKNFIVRYYRRSYAPDRPYLQFVITDITNKFYLQYTSGNDYAIKSKTNTPFNYYYLDSYTSDSQITDWVKSENVTAASAFGASVNGYASLYDVYDNNQDTGNAIYSALNIQATSYLTMNIQNKTDTMLRPNSNISLGSTYDKVAEAIGLVAEKIVKGNTILDIEGTADVGPITQEEYEECLLLSQQILGLVSI